MLQKISFTLIGGGLVAALVYFFKWFFATSLIALGFRVAVAVAILGILLLLATAAWERYRVTKKGEREKELREVKY